MSLSSVAGHLEADWSGRRDGLGAEEAAFIAKHHYRGTSSQAIARMLGRPVPDVQAIRAMLDDPQVMPALLEDMRLLRAQLAALSRAANAWAMPSVPAAPAEAPAPPVRSWDVITGEVAARHGSTLEALVGYTYRLKLGPPRQEAWSLIYACGRLSLPQIGQRFGGRDHTTILSGIRHHAQRVAEAADA